MGNRFREEHATGVAFGWLIIDPDEQVLVDQGGEDEEGRAETVDNRRDDTVCDHYSAFSSTLIQSKEAD